MLAAPLFFAGYSNEPGQEYWICKNSWGQSFAFGGYFKVGFGKSYICGEAWGLEYTLANPPPLPVARNQLAASTSRPGCYDYKASDTDYVGRVAYLFRTTSQRVLLDNRGAIPEPEMALGGTTIVLCGISLPGFPTALSLSGESWWGGGTCGRRHAHCCQPAGTWRRFLQGQMASGTVVTPTGAGGGAESELCACPAGSPFWSSCVAQHLPHCR